MIPGRGPRKTSGHPDTHPDTYPSPRGGTAWKRHGAATRLALMMGQRKEGAC